MKVGIKRKWLRLLRSGRFAQTTGYLRRRHGPRSKDEGFCCLGVLQVAATGSKPPLRPSGFSRSLLSDGMLERCGLSGVQAARLSILNDIKGWSFKRIAAYISRNM